MAFTNVPQWVTASGGTLAATITPVTIAANGDITEVTGSAATITTRLDGVTINVTKETEEISPITGFQRNEVPISTGTTIELREIVPSTGISSLLDLAFGYDYAKIVFARGSTPRTWTHYGPFIDVSETVVGKGKILVVARFGMSAGNDDNSSHA